MTKRLRRRVTEEERIAEKKKEAERGLQVKGVRPGATKLSSLSCYNFSSPQCHAYYRQRFHFPMLNIPAVRKMGSVRNGIRAYYLWEIIELMFNYISYLFTNSKKGWERCGIAGSASRLNDGCSPGGTIYPRCSRASSSLSTSIPPPSLPPWVPLPNSMRCFHHAMDRWHTNQTNICPLNLHRSSVYLRLDFRTQIEE